jgi:hypothetical protein
MVKKKTSPKTSLVVTGKCEVTKSAKAKVLEADHTKSLGNRGKGMGTSKKKGRGRNGCCLLTMRMIAQMGLLKERKMRRLNLSMCRCL